MLHLESLVCYACRTNQNLNFFGEFSKESSVIPFYLSDNEKRRAFVGTCGHSICLTCAKSNPNISCPICSRSNAFINGTVNYGSTNIIEQYESNVFQLFKKWWQQFNSGIGVCCNCLDHKLLRICMTCKKKKDLKDVDILKYALCQKCQDRYRSDKRSEEEQEKYRGYLKDENKPIECRICHNATTNPFFDSTWFELNTLHLNLDTLNFCADCILDDHANHDTSKMSNNTSQSKLPMRILTVQILEKLLERKLEVDEDQMKCKLRHMRMIMTSEEAIRRAKDPRPFFNETKNASKTPEDYIERLISSLETQYHQYQDLKSTCHCVEVWKDVVKLNIFDFFERNPHFYAMVEKTDLEETLNGCPFEFESSKHEKEMLLEIIRKGEKVSKSREMTKPHKLLWN
ncbi:hypothetical protein CRE_24579 [Caenorhabditis remanei]|uniref:RING-type domain-containing protein n=1 Tax=Caenorhabditis remanei TaxID=31234 RepID=E3MVA3_CAERE|nr:hypothetical protein CRE_24579 [Caenorhabditis remanei]